MDGIFEIRRITDGEYLGEVDLHDELGYALLSSHDGTIRHFDSLRALLLYVSKIFGEGYTLVRRDLSQ